MQNKKIIESDIDFTNAFRLISQAYEEIAVMKMRKIRASVVKTREYYAKLTEIFIDVKTEQRKQLEEMEKKMHRMTQKGEKPSKIKIKVLKLEKKVEPKLNKTVSVFLSANTTLYGDLIERVFRLFVDKTSKDDSDIIIVGRVGKRLYDEQEKKKQYLYFEIPDVEISIENLRPILFHLVKYKNVMVYYGKFENIVIQIPTISNITGDLPFLAEDKKKTQPVGPGQIYLFEPSFEALLRFFEDLMVTSLFRQTVHESQLSRLASRIMSMEKAQQNIETQIRKLRFGEKKIVQLEDNNRQIERLSGMRLWLR